MVQNKMLRLDHSTINAAVARLQETSSITPGTAVVSYFYSSSLCSLVSPLALALIAASELAHLGPLLKPGFVAPRVFQIGHHIRWVLGTIAIITPLLPTSLFYFWMRSNGLIPSG
jgi:hypothetical protein